MTEIEQAINTLLDMSAADLARFAWGKKGYIVQKILPPIPATHGRPITVEHLCRVRHHDEEALVHLEVCATPSPNLSRLIAAKGARAFLETNLTPLSTLYWLVKDQPPPRSPYQMWRQTHTWLFDTVDIPRLPASTLLEAELPGLLPLVAFAQDTSAAIIETARRQLPTGAPRQQADLLESLLLRFWTHVQKNSA